ncbi:plasmid mobilization protein [Halomonas sp. 3D7M]|uniref:plasmid mobilization protein n=1 Tax=Halomonas sp. 3D7M TaxID=2742617 RepID=UPI0018679E4B|nr:relaxosome protein [Halomonas sp. 3D7M]
MAKQTGDSIVISFRLSAAEYEPYRVALEKSGKNRSQFFREVFLTLKPKIEIKAKTETPTDYKKLLFVANKASNNLNQIAYQLNYAAKSNIINRSMLNRGINLLASIEKYMRRGVRNAR